MTATELMAGKARRLDEDPTYRAEVERQEAERQARVDRERQAEQPLVEDLRRLGLNVNSVWDLHKVPDSRPRAIPVLLDHITRDYPDGVLMGIGAGLDDRSAHAWWGELRGLLRGASRDVVRDRAASALAACATRENYDDLLSFMADEGLGAARVYFVRPVNRIGNKISPGQGRSVLEALTDDAVLGKEATAVLKGRGRNQ
jgi:hypothetical protein